MTEEQNEVTPEENHDSANDTATQAKEIGQKALSEAKVVTLHAADAIKTLISDPIGGQASCISTLGVNALPVGIAFIAIFVLVNGIVPNGMMGDQFHVRLFSAAGFAGGLLGAIFVIGKLFGSGAHLIGSLFTTGVALLPLTIGFTLAYLLKGSLNTSIGALLFTFIITVLLANASIKSVQNASERATVILTPIAILAGMLGKYIMGTIFG